MTLLRFEIRKLLRTNRGAVVTALFLAAELLLCVLTDFPANPDAELYREQYLHYLEQVDGAWTREKADFLEHEAARGADGLYAEGLDVIYEQYRYVNEEKEDRFFLDANGWASLLRDRALDLTLAAAIILLSVPVYCGEAASGMESLALTSRNGRRLFLLQKTALTLAAAAALSLSTDLIRLVFCAAKYGLPHPDYPMQSVEAFGGAEKVLTLAGAEALAAALRLLGSLELAAVTLCLSAYCRRFALAAFLASAAAVLPWIGLGQETQYALPLPSSLMMPVGFLRGSEYAADAASGETVAVFREATAAQTAAVALGAALVTAVCILLLRRRYGGYIAAGRGALPKTAALGLALCFLLGGCGDAAPPEEDVIYNSRDNAAYEYGGLTVTSENGRPVVRDGDGNVTALPLDPLAPVDGAVYIEHFFARGRYVYFRREFSESVGWSLADDSGKTYVASLLRVDLDTFKTEVVFETVTQHTVFGIDIGGGTPDPLGRSDFIVDDEYIYVPGTGGRRVEISTGRMSPLDIPTNRNVAYDGRSIFYVDRSGILTRFDTESDETCAVSSEPVSDFRLTESGIVTEP